LQPYFVKQPNGKLALFSPSLGQFTFCDMTDAEAVDYGVGRWGEAAQSFVLEAAEDRPIGDEEQTAGRLSRWRSALTTIATLHGIDGIERALSLLGVSDADVPQSALDAALSVARR
jgi:hypothetical protein